MRCQNPEQTLGMALIQEKGNGGAKWGLNIGVFLSCKLKPSIETGAPGEPQLLENVWMFWQFLGTYLKTSAPKVFWDKLIILSKNDLYSKNLQCKKLPPCQLFHLRSSAKKTHLCLLVPPHLLQFGLGIFLALSPGPVCDLGKFLIKSNKNCFQRDKTKQERAKSVLCIENASQHTQSLWLHCLFAFTAFPRFRHFY